MKKLLTKMACIQKFIKRDYILLVDNVLNDGAELCDNYALFEYLQSKPEYKDISFYVINKRSSQYDEIKNKYPKNIIPVNGSKVSYALIKKLVRTKYWLDSFQVINKFSSNLKRYLNMSDITTVYTQHGINFMKIAPLEEGIGIGDQTFDKIVMANEKERQFFKRYYGFNDKNVILAGLSRWDNMKIANNDEEKSIFVYLTFRRYLIDTKGIKVELTDYIKNVADLCSSERLSNILKAKNIKLHVAVHHLVSSHLGDINLPNIELVDEKDIGKYKPKASLFVTDYSSMSFDYMFNDIPVIYYRLDYKNPILAVNWGDRVNEANAESNNDKVYNVFYDKDSVIDKIEYYCNNGFQLEDEYKKINDKFFTYRENIRQHIIEGLLSSPDNIPNDCDREPAKDIEYNKEYSFSDDFLPEVSTENLSRPAKCGKKTKQRNARLWFKLPSKAASDVVFNLEPRLGKKVKKTAFKIYLNDKFIDRITLKTNDEISIPITTEDTEKKIQKVEFIADNVNFISKQFKAPECKKLNLNIKTIKVQEQM